MEIRLSGRRMVRKNYKSITKMEFQTVNGPLGLKMVCSQVRKISKMGLVHGFNFTKMVRKYKMEITKTTRNTASLLYGIKMVR